MRVADAVVDILRSEGVKFVAALPGDDILPLFDAFHQQNDIPLILTRHEQATVFMADGYARSCGEPGVAMVTKGPGRCNAMTAIVNAFTDCVPLVVIFGHSSRKQLAKGMLQEVPYLDTSKPWRSGLSVFPRRSAFPRYSAAPLPWRARVARGR